LSVCVCGLGGRGRGSGARAPASAVGALRRLRCGARPGAVPQNSLRAPSVHCAQTAATSQITKRVSSHAPAPRTALLAAPEVAHAPDPLPRRDVVLVRRMGNPWVTTICRPQASSVSCPTKKISRQPQWARCRRSSRDKERPVSGTKRSVIPLRAIRPLSLHSGIPPSAFRWQFRAQLGRSTHQSLPDGCESESSH